MINLERLKNNFKTKWLKTLLQSKRNWTKESPQNLSLTGFLNMVQNVYP